MPFQNSFNTEKSSNDGVVVDVVRQKYEWRVQVQGIYWFARTKNRPLDLMPGDTIRIVGRQGLKLIIEPA